MKLLILITLISCGKQTIYEPKLWDITVRQDRPLTHTEEINMIRSCTYCSRIAFMDSCTEIEQSTVVLPVEAFYEGNKCYEYYVNCLKIRGVEL